MSGERAERTRQTRRRIKEALVELIAEKGFDSLTVSDVTRRAHINRGTFYLHFTDKYDMMAKLEDELIARLEQVLLQEGDEPHDPRDLFPYERLLPALELVAQDIDFVRAVAGRGGDPEFSCKLRSVIEGLFAQGLERSDCTLRDDDELPLVYARELALSHVLTIINLWLERGGTESPEQLARIIVGAKDVSPASLLIGDRLT